MTSRRISEIATHLRRPTGIASSDFTRIRMAAGKAEIHYDLWQQGLLALIYAKRADGMYACGEGGAVVSICRQVGKTYSIGSSVFIQAILTPRLKVLWTAHRTRTSDETFQTMCDFAKNKTLARYVETIRRANGQQEIRFSNGSRIMFGAREQGFGRGFDDVDMEVFDEAQILTVKALDDMIPATNTAKNPLIIFMGTPPKPGDPCEAFAEKRQQALAGLDGMLYVELSADPKADTDDRMQWAKANPSYPERTSEAAILRMRNLLGEDSFRREGLGIWDETVSTAAIDPKLWDDGTVKARPAGGLASFGLDMPPDRSTIAIGACMKYADGTAHIEMADIKDARHEGTAWAVQWIADRWEHTCAVTIDRQSPAYSLVPDLKRRHVMVTVTNTAEMGQAVGRVMDMLREHKLTHLNDGDQPQLAAAVKGATLRDIGANGLTGWNKKGSDADISPLVACTLALHGAFTTNRDPTRVQEVW